MKKLISQLPVVQVLVCTNDRPNDQVCCKKVGGNEFHLALKQRIKDNNLRARLVATRTGCLGFCNNVGCTVTIHRKGEEPEWLTECSQADFETIWEKITQP